MDNPRPEKTAVVAEVRRRLADSPAVVLTEYRGMNVSAMGDLRTKLREVGGEYTVYKNTLVRFATRELGLEVDELLVGPTALAFVGSRPDGTPGDAPALAKALKEFAAANDKLVLKGAILDDKVLTVADVMALADLPSREQLFAEFAGAMESILADFAGLLDAKLREFGYAMSALIDKGGPGGAGSPDAAAAEETPATEDNTGSDDQTETEEG